MKDLTFFITKYESKTIVLESRKARTFDKNILLLDIIYWKTYF